MPDPRIDLLLKHSGWVRDLARTLVRDPGLADDIVQDTWVSALRRPPSDLNSPRGWLRTLLKRHLRQARRGARRRARREEWASRERDQPPAASEVESQDQNRMLVRAVLDLREPFRTTVLLRYVEELTPEEISERMRTPLPTVHSRLSRGLATLRRRLAGKDRASELMALFLLRLRLRLHTRLARERGLLRPGTVVCTSLGVCGLVLFLGREGVGRPHSSVLLPRTVSLGEDRPGPFTPSAATGSVTAERVEVAAGESRTVLGRVLDTLGRPVAGVSVGIEGSDEVRVTSAADGSFRLPSPDTRTAVGAHDPRHSSVLLGVLDPEREAEVAVVVGPRVHIAGRVLTSSGDVPPGAFVMLFIDPRLEVSFERPLEFSRPPTRVAAVARDGSFAFEDLPSIRAARLVVWAGGQVVTDRAIPEQDRADVLIRLPPGATEPLRGRVVDALGRPAAGAFVSAPPLFAACDERGAFEIGLPEGCRSIVAFVPGGSAIARTLPQAATAPLDVAGSLLWLPKRAGAIEGRVLDEGGRPWCEALVWLADPTPFGAERGAPLTVETRVADASAEVWQPTRTDAGGRFRLGGLLEREYLVRAVDPLTLSRAEARVRPGDALELRLPDARAGTGLHATVRDIEGRPLQGIRAALALPAFEFPLPGFDPQPELKGPSVRSDALGRFELPAGSWRGTLLRLESDEILTSSFDLGALKPGEALDLVANRRVHLQVEVDDPAWASTFEVHDADDATLPLVLLREGCSHPCIRGSLDRGRSQVLTVADTARQLVLYQERIEVARVPIEPQVGRVNVYRP